MFTLSLGCWGLFYLLIILLVSCMLVNYFLMMADDKILKKKRKELLEIENHVSLYFGLLVDFMSFMILYI